MPAGARVSFISSLDHWNLFQISDFEYAGGIPGFRASRVLSRIRAVIARRGGHLARHSNGVW